MTVKQSSDRFTRLPVDYIRAEYQRKTTTTNSRTIFNIKYYGIRQGPYGIWAQKNSPVQEIANDLNAGAFLLRTSPGSVVWDPPVMDGPELCNLEALCVYRDT